MKRSNFLGIISGLIASPFIKRNEIALPPPMKLQCFERATFTNSKEKQEEFLQMLPTRFEIKGSDLVVVIEKVKLRRGHF